MKCVRKLVGRLIFPFVGLVAFVWAMAAAPSYADSGDSDAIWLESKQLSLLWLEDDQPLADTGESSIDGLMPTRPLFVSPPNESLPVGFIKPDCFSPSSFCELRGPPLL